MSCRLETLLALRTTWLEWTSLPSNQAVVGLGCVSTCSVSIPSAQRGGRPAGRVTTAADCCNRRLLTTHCDGRLTSWPAGRRALALFDVTPHTTSYCLLPRTRSRSQLELSHHQLYVYWLSRVRHSVNITCVVCSLTWSLLLLLLRVNGSTSRKMLNKLYFDHAHGKKSLYLSVYYVSYVFARFVDSRRSPGEYKYIGLSVLCDLTKCYMNYSIPLIIIATV